MACILSLSTLVCYWQQTMFKLNLLAIAVSCLDVLILCVSIACELQITFAASSVKSHLCMAFKIWFGQLANAN